MRLIYLKCCFIAMLFSSVELVYAQAVENIPIETIPFRLVDDIIYIQISVNDLDSLSFIFDTGASNTLINPHVAQSLGLESKESGSAYGASGSYDIKIHPDNSIKLGGLILDNIMLIENDNPLESTIFGEELDGVVGYDILSKFIVDINYNDLIITLFSFDDYNYSGDQEGVDFELFSNLPLIDASVKINGETYHDKFIIDTGAQLRLLLVNPFINKHSLKNNLGDHFTLSKAIGISNDKVDLIGAKIESLLLFKNKFDHIPIITSYTDQGVFGIPQIGGILGNGILKKFNTVYDYRSQKIYLETNDLFGEPFQVDCFGGSFERLYKERRVVLESIIKGSVAEEAGFLIGDEITSIDGISITTITNDQFLKTLGQDGKEIDIIYIRNGKTYKTTVKLRALI